MAFKTIIVGATHRAAQAHLKLSWRLRKELWFPPLGAPAACKDRIGQGPGVQGGTRILQLGQKLNRWAGGRSMALRHSCLCASDSETEPAASFGVKTGGQEGHGQQVLAKVSNRGQHHNYQQILT